MTEEQGDEEAVGAVERFVEAVEHTLPDDARIIKTIGDEVMVVGSDPATLTDWAVGFQELYGRAAAAADRHPLRRDALPRRRLLRPRGQPAARVAARAAGGEVLVTRPVVEAAGAHLEFERIGEVRLKGFADPTELFLARWPRRSRPCRNRQTRASSSTRSAPAGCWRRGGRVVVLLSGGRDSVCLLDVAVRRGGAGVRAARQLRAARRGRRRRGALRALCERLGVPLEVERARAPARAATSRRGRATSATPRRRVRAAARGASVAAGHTATDQAETILYRLASSPGRARAAGDGGARRRLVRPLLRRHARGDRGVLPRARPGVARGRDQRVGRLRARPRARGAAAGAARDPSGRRAQRRARGRAAARRGRGARRGGRRTSLDGARPRLARARCARAAARARPRWC